MTDDKEATSPDSIETKDGIIDGYTKTDDNANNISARTSNSNTTIIIVITVFLILLMCCCCCSVITGTGSIPFSNSRYNY